MSLLRARLSQADQRLQEVGARLALWQIDRPEQLEVAKAVWMPVSFKRAVHRHRGVVAVEELQVGVGGQTQVHVPAWWVVHCGGGRVGEVLERVAVKRVSGLVCILIKIIRQRGPAYIVCECVCCGWSHAVSSRAVRDGVAVELTAHVVVILRVTDIKGTSQPAVDLREVLAPREASPRIGVGGRAGGFSHVAAAAVLLHC